MEGPNEGKKISPLQEKKDEVAYGLTPEDVFNYTLERSADNVHIIREQEATIAGLGLDVLTGALTLKSFEEALEKELEHVRGEIPEHRKGEHPHQVALMFIDLDHFKVANDTYGHGIGDDVLKVATKVFMHSVRETDKVGRKGGDEFVIMLPGANQATAERVGNVILKGLRTDSLLNQYGITASIGVSTSATSADLKGLMTSADQAMYRAKNAGRNQMSA